MLAVLLAAASLVSAAPRDEAPAPQPVKVATTDAVLPGGQAVKLVNRDQLRVKAGTRSLVVPRHLRGVMAEVPTPPKAYDWSRQGKIDMPILGNDRYGDCYYVYMAHQVQLWTGMNDRPTTFATNALISRYLALSGGDRGLSDDDIFGRSHNGEFYKGVVGPNGPNKILDHMVIRPDDPGAIALAQWAFGGTAFTASLPNAWINNARAGATWDRGTPNPNNGHAMLLSGRRDDGTWIMETWGIGHPNGDQIKLTQAGLESADPEVLVCFSLLWFNPATGFAPNGLHYVDLAKLWKTLGGRDLPASPFPPPVPTPPSPPSPPTPPTPGPATGPITLTVNGETITIDPAAKSVTLPAGWTTGAGLKAELEAAGLDPNLIAAVLQLVADVKGKKGFAVVLADVMAIIALVNQQKTGLDVPDVMPARRYADFVALYYGTTPTSPGTLYVGVAPPPDAAGRVGYAEPSRYTFARGVYDVRREGGETRWTRRPGEVALAP